MARKLKTYVTTSGFYDLAVAAPSMKAALEIWESHKNLFYQGFAKETDEPAIIEATMAEPGVVLRRAVGTKGVFRKDAELPKLSVLQKAIRNKKPPEPQPKRSAKVTKRSKADPAASRKATQLYDFAEKRREREEARARAQEEKERERTQCAVDKAKAALHEARAEHETRVSGIEKDREAIDRRAQKEEERWEKEKERLEDALDRARE